MARENNTNKSLTVDVALLKQSTSVLEQTVVAQNATMNAELLKINATLREVHDKIDRTILSHAITLTKHEGELHINKEAVAAVNTRLSRTAGIVVGFITAIAGGVATWLGAKSS